MLICTILCHSVWVRVCALVGACFREGRLSVASGSISLGNHNFTQPGETILFAAGMVCFVTLPGPPMSRNPALQFCVGGVQVLTRVIFRIPTDSDKNTHSKPRIFVYARPCKKCHGTRPSRTCHGTRPPVLEDTLILGTGENPFRARPRLGRKSTQHSSCVVRLTLDRE